MKVKPSFKSLFWPTFIELLFFMLMGTMDTLMLANYDDFAVGAVGNANTLINMFAVLLLVVSSGVAVLVAQYLGANKPKVAHRVIGSGLFMNLIVGTILASTLMLLARQFLGLVNTQNDIFDDSKTYLQVIAMSLFFVALSNVITASLRAHSHAKQITIVVMVANVLNILGNYVLIYGKLGFPSLGVYGAGLSTLIVRAMMMLTYFVLLFKVLHVTLKDIRFNMDTIKQIIRIGLPSALESWTYTVMQAIILIWINGFGTEFVIARSYINVILTYIYVFSVAFASANSVMTGHYVGERQFEKAYKETFRIVTRSFIFVITATLTINLFSGAILQLFTSNEVIINIARRILWLAIFLEFGRAINLIMIQALRAAGDATFPLIMAFISMFGIAVTSAYVLGVHFGLGLFGVYLAYVFDEVFRAGFMVFRWRSGKWQSKSNYLESTV